MRFLLFILLLNIVILAKSSVWVVKSKDSEIYLGGSIHLLRESDHPLPVEFEKAYSKSEIVVFETDIGMSREEAQNLINQKGFYPDGISIKDKISKERYKKLQNYCDRVGFPILYIEKMKVPLAMFTLSLVEYQKLGIDDKLGVDMYFYKKSVEDNRSVDIFESVEEQMDFFVKMGEGKEDLFVEKFLEDMKEQNSNLVKVIEAWRDGDDEVIIKYLLDLKKYPNTYEELVVNRNSNWMNKIEKFLATPKKEFIIVGVAHLVGEDGILKKLRDLGYEVKRF